MIYLDLPPLQPADPSILPFPLLCVLPPSQCPGPLRPLGPPSLAAWLQLTCGMAHSKHLMELLLRLQKAISPNHCLLMPLTPGFHTHTHIHRTQLSTCGQNTQNIQNIHFLPQPHIQTYDEAAFAWNHKSTWHSFKFLQEYKQTFKLNIVNFKQTTHIMNRFAAFTFLSLKATWVSLLSQQTVYSHRIELDISTENSGDAAGSCLLHFYRPPPDLAFLDHYQLKRFSALFHNMLAQLPDKNVEAWKIRRKVFLFWLGPEGSLELEQTQLQPASRTSYHWQWD